MELKDLQGKPISEMTSEELEDNIRQLRKLKITVTKSKSGKPKATKSNKEKQLEDLLKNLSLEKLKALKEML